MLHASLHEQARRFAIEKPDHRRRRLLRFPHQRSPGCRAGEEGDELVARNHSITSSACTRKSFGDSGRGRLGSLVLTTNPDNAAGITTCESGSTGIFERQMFRV